MGLFGKNPNETAFTGGKKHWSDVIKNTGDGNLLIWRQPEEDFNTNSTLVVMPGEEAIFIKGGMIEQVFENGTYKLSTQNYPFISRLRNAFSGGISTFNCVVYFVRKAHSMEILWGTSSPIQVRDKYHDIRTDVRANGSYKVQITNPGMFLEKLVGNNVPFQTQDDLDMFFFNEFQGRIKSVVSKYLNNLNCELIGLDEHLCELSDEIQPYIDETLSAYGLKCVKFSLAGMDIDTSKYDKIDEYQIDLTIGEIKKAQGQKAAAHILGEDFGTIKSAEILTNVSVNQGAGGIAAAGAGMGMGMAAGNVFGAMALQMFNPLNGGNLGQQKSQQMGGQQSENMPGQIVSGRFTQQGAENVNEQPTQNEGQTGVQPTVGIEPAQDPMEALKLAKQLLDAGFMSPEEFERKRMEIISRL